MLRNRWSSPAWLTGHYEEAAKPDQIRYSAQRSAQLSADEGVQSIHQSTLVSLNQSVTAVSGLSEVAQENCSGRLPASDRESEMPGSARVVLCTRARNHPFRRPHQLDTLRRTSTHWRAPADPLSLFFLIYNIILTQAHDRAGGGQGQAQARPRPRRTGLDARRQARAAGRIPRISPPAAARPLSVGGIRLYSV